MEIASEEEKLYKAWRFTDEILNFIVIHFLKPLDENFKLNLLAFLFVLGIAVGHMLGAKDSDNRITRFGDGAVRGGWLGFLVGIIMIASSPSASQMNFSAIMPAFAVAALTPLYGYFLKLISMQLDW